jgi:hypothetical protein
MDFNYGKLWTGIGPLNHASTHKDGSFTPPPNTKAMREPPALVSTILPTTPNTPIDSLDNKISYAQN